MMRLVSILLLGCVASAQAQGFRDCDQCPEMVPIPGVSGLLDDQGNLQGTEIHEKSAGGMLNSLEKWSGALKTLRQ